MSRSRLQGDQLARGWLNLQVPACVQKSPKNHPPHRVHLVTSFFSRPFYCPDKGQWTAGQRKSPTFLKLLAIYLKPQLIHRSWTGTSIMPVSLKILYCDTRPTSKWWSCRAGSLGKGRNWELSASCHGAAQCLWKHQRETACCTPSGGSVEQLAPLCPYSGMSEVFFNS